MELWELRQKQKLPLNIKIKMTERRIRDFYEHFHGNVYISFSGGKDSTVLLHLVRKLYSDVKAVYCDTGLEYPEINEFVKSFGNVEIIKPTMSFKQVLDTYGYPVVSKSVAQKIREIRTTKSQKLKLLRLHGKNKGIFGKLPEKYKYLINAPFKISEQCCDVMKKRPFKKFRKKTGLNPFIGTMASDSSNREIAYLKTGCNSFDLGKSQPLSFWSTEDVWQFIKQEKIDYCNIYDMGLKSTGCVFCMFGIQYDKPNNRFQCMAKTHPQLYDYCIKKLGIGKVLKFMNIPYDGFQEVILEKYTSSLLSELRSD